MRSELLSDKRTRKIKSYRHLHSYKDIFTEQKYMTSLKNSWLSNKDVPGPGGTLFVSESNDQCYHQLQPAQTVREERKYEINAKYTLNKLSKD